MIKYKKTLATITITSLLFVFLYMQFPPTVKGTNYVKKQSAYEYVNTVEADNGAFFAKSTWSAAHRDSRNSDYIPMISPSTVTRTWEGIEGGNFFMGPVIGPDGTVYATSAGGVGHSHLHAFDGAGNLLWKSKPMTTEKDLDSAAYFSAPVIDIQNNIFLPDKNQLWSYDSSGAVRWVTELSDYGIEGYVFSVVFSKEGYGILTSSDGIIALFDRNDGSMQLQSLELPGVAGIDGVPVPKGFLKGMIDDQILQDTWDGIFGFKMEVANTTAIDPITNRMFVVATGRKPDDIVVYGIDITSTGLKIAFESLIGTSGSGTSPTLSFDGDLVFIADGKGIMNGISTKNGEIVWKNEQATVTGVSPTTTPNNRLFSFNTEEIHSIDTKTGETIWSKDISELLFDGGYEESLRSVTGFYGTHDASLHSGIMATEDGMWMIVALNTQIPIPESRRGNIKIPIEGIRTDVFAQPLSYHLVKLDYDGNLVYVTDFVDGGALLSMGLDGKIFITTLSVISSIAYHNANPKMLFFMRNTPKPYGGLIAYEPNSYFDYFKARIDNAINLANQITQNNGVERPIEQQALVHLNLSLSSTHLSLIEALSNKEIDQKAFDTIEAQLSIVREKLPTTIEETKKTLQLLSEVVKLY